MKLKIKYGDLMPDNIGNQSMAFLFFYLRDPFYVLPHINYKYIDKSYYVSDLAPINFLKTETLNKELYYFLLDIAGFDKNDLDFILKEEKRNVTAQSKRIDYYFSTELKEFVREKEKILFELFPEYDR